MSFSQKISFFIFLPILGLFLCAEISQAAYQGPSSNPVGDNDVYSYIYNDLGGSNDIYIFGSSFGIGGDFTVNNDNFFADVSSSRVGVGTNTPQATLDVAGLVHIAAANYADFPSCSYYMQGALMFNLDQDRLNICSNGGWRHVGYDNDLDGWLDYMDCNENDPNINPGVDEVCGDTVDDNCDGSLTVGCSNCLVDADEDNYGNMNGEYIWLPTGECPDYAGDCDDDDPTLNPGSEACGDWISNDCDSLVNEVCSCTSDEWTALSCPSMAGCDEHVDLTATKLTDCIGSAPTLHCTCVCRVEHFIAPVPPTCPVCRSINITVYSTKVSGIECTDSNSISDTYCLDNCSGYCSGTTCCNLSTYYTCSGSYRVYHNACGDTSSTYCEFGCEDGSCKSDPCLGGGEANCIACGGTWHVNPINGGTLCITVH